MAEAKQEFHAAEQREVHYIRHQRTWLRQKPSPPPDDGEVYEMGFCFCGKRSRVRNMCQMHYMRWWKRRDKKKRDALKNVAPKEP